MACHKSSLPLTFCTSTILANVLLHVYKGVCSLQHVPYTFKVSCFSLSPPSCDLIVLLVWRRNTLFKPLCKVWRWNPEIHKRRRLDSLKQFLKNFIHFLLSKQKILVDNRSLQVYNKLLLYLCICTQKVVKIASLSKIISCIPWVMYSVLLHIQRKILRKRQEMMCSR